MRALGLSAGGLGLYVRAMGAATCSLRFLGNALPLERMRGELGLADARCRAALRWPPEWDGVARTMIWTALWECWPVPQPRVVRVGNATADAIGRMLDHLESRRDALARILATQDALGEVYVRYTRVREVMSVLPPALHGRLAACALATRVELTGALG